MPELPTTMRALVHSSTTGPAGVAVREVPVPAPGRGEVVLRVDHAGFNRHELFTTLRRDGSEEPLVVGADAAGVVAAAGSGADHRLVGTRRLLNPCPGWSTADQVPEHPRILGSAAPGTFAEYVAVQVDCLAAVPAHLTPAEAGALGLAAVTAYRALFTVGELRPGEHVLIPGIGGGAALLALDMALAAGAEVSVSSRSAATGEFAVSRGATRAIPSDAEPADALPRPVDLVLDGVGKATVPGGLRALRPGGRLVTYGATTGPDLALSLRETFFRQVSIRGTSMGSAQEFAAMMDLVAAHRIRPVVGSVRPLADGPAVFAESIEATGVGKTVFAVGTREHKEAA